MARAASTSSASSSSLSSDSERSPKRRLKRKHDESDSATESGSVSSSDSSSCLSASKNDTTGGWKNVKVSSTTKIHAVEQQPLDDEDEVQALSHKTQRKLKKKQKLLESQPSTSSEQSKLKQKKADMTQNDKPKRQNSVWVGNLSFKTKPDALRRFFADAGEITRVHMPTKALHGTKLEGEMRGENRGFAYVDFATPDAKVNAIAMSEKNLDGRRLLIKDGDDFTGRPITANAEQDGGSLQKPGGPSTGLSKTAQKILARQKQPACPCLFLGNLGFDATEHSVREMFERNARSQYRWAQKDKSGGKKRKGKEADLEDADNELGETDGAERKDAGIRKVRLGTFEDSGNCKGFGFADFETTAQATAALINPYNHSLDGRSLVVEYASLDAARRGGYRPPVTEGEAAPGKRNGKHAGGRSVKGDRNKATVPREKENAELTNPSRSQTHENTGNEDTETKASKRNAGEDGERPAKKSRGPEEKWANSKHRRSKPGAALAMAQREKVAIVPSTGTRLTFT